MKLFIALFLAAVPAFADLSSAKFTVGARVVRSVTVRMEGERMTAVTVKGSMDLREAPAGAVQIDRTGELVMVTVQADALGSVAR